MLTKNQTVGVVVLFVALILAGASFVAYGNGGLLLSEGDILNLNHLFPFAEKFLLGFIAFFLSVAGGAVLFVFSIKNKGDDQ